MPCKVAREFAIHGCDGLTCAPGAQSADGEGHRWYRLLMTQCGVPIVHLKLQLLLVDRLTACCRRCVSPACPSPAVGVY
jgi:hypothetical protein